MAEYGKMGSREELAKSGYILPDSHFVTPAPDGSGEMSEAERAELDAMKKEDAGSPTVDNKAVIPARKSARTRK